MMMFERQIKGMITVSILLSFIPFISFLYASNINFKRPVLSNSSADTLIIEVVSENGVSGIFFVEPKTSANKLFSTLGFKKISTEDFTLQNGTKIRFIEEGNNQGFVVEKMDAAKRLALGLPLDINLVSREELILIPGIGDVLSVNIVAWRDKIGRFNKLEQLMDIKGIKEKKLSNLKKYLYVDQFAK
jgi:competence protein ComEA